MICKDKQAPKREPIFHMKERFIGEARSIMRLFSGLISLRGGRVMVTLCS